MIKQVSIILLMVSLLTSCMTIATTGASAIYDKNRLMRKWSDESLEIKAYNKILIKTDRYKNDHVTVTIFNNVILLTGQVIQPQHKQEIEHLVENIPNHSKIYNFITVSSPVSPAVRINDSWLTAKIITQIIANRDTDPNKIKVITEDGTVYLMGILTSEEADAACEIARTTEGVEKVVKVFSYIKIVKS